MGREEPGESHPIMNKWRGAWVVPTQVRVVWAALGNLHMSPELSLLLACLTTTICPAQTMGQTDK
jgi:hypothetical protein